MTVPRPGGFVSALMTDMFFPAWGKLRELDVDKRWDAIQDEAFRSALIDAAKADPRSEAVARGLRWMGDGERPVYTRRSDDNLLAMAQAAVEHPAQTWLRLMLESDGKTVFHRPFFNMDFDAVESLMARDWVVPGLGDAGAHVSQIMDSGWASFLLSHWVRDAGKVTLAEAVRAYEPAPRPKCWTLPDRGVLAVGKKGGTINVLDPGRGGGSVNPPSVRDFPHGKSRLIQRAVGYKATLVNGQVMLLRRRAHRLLEWGACCGAEGGTGHPQQRLGRRAAGACQRSNGATLSNAPACQLPTSCAKSGGIPVQRSTMRQRSKKTPVSQRHPSVRDLALRR